jgi:hypothetical protein
MYLTRPQKNNLFEAIARGGLDLGQCDLKTTPDGFTITHDSGSTLEAGIVTSRLRHYVVTNLGIGSGRFILLGIIKEGSSWQREVKGDVNDLLPAITKWAADVEEIINMPDYWADMKRGRTLIADIQDSQDAQNTPFEQDERDQIAAQLNRIRESLADKFELSNEQMEHIAEKFDEAAEASKRMGRKDWLLLFGGTMFNLIVTDTVTPSVAGHIFTTVVQGLIHLFTGGPPQILTLG